MGETVSTGLPCVSCSSSDAMSIYVDGWGHCFSCDGDFHPSKIGSTDVKPKRKSKVSNEFISWTIPNEIRSIKEETLKKWEYGYGSYNGRKCHVANYYDDNGELTGQKLRFSDKTFTSIGEDVVTTLFGKQLWKASNYNNLVITEGEIDALSYADVVQNKYPVVSIPFGVKSAEKCIKANLKWIEQNFKEVILMFDNDEHGKKAARECAQLFSPNKCKIATLPLKDANDMLRAGQIKDLMNAIFRAAPFRPDGIKTGAEVKSAALEPVKIGYSYPYESLTNITYGARKQEVVVIGAGSGVGKTDLFKEIATHFRIKHNLKVGLIFLEEANPHTLLSMVSKVVSKPIHLPGVEISDEDKNKGFDSIIGESGEDLVMYDHFGYMDWPSIRDTIKYMVVTMGCDFIFLDHITMLTQSEDVSDERKTLDNICNEAASMCRRYNFGLFMISHLSKPTGGRKPHEEGGRVFLQDLRGSSSIKQLASYVFGIERDQQKNSPSTIRVLKDRFTGQALGKTIDFIYVPQTGRLEEYNPVLHGEIGNDQVEMEF